jgi:DNA-binding transcriptional regulator YhcF (GntR family)
MQITKEEYRTVRNLSKETKSLLIYAMIAHDPREPLPTPAAYSRIVGCSSSLASVAYRELKQLDYIVVGYEEGMFCCFLNPYKVWRGTNHSRSMQKARVARAIEAMKTANFPAKAQEAGLNARQRK